MTSVTDLAAKAAQRNAAKTSDRGIRRASGQEQSMPLNDRADPATVLSAAIALIAAGVAGFALIYARKQILGTSDIAKETTALTAYPGVPSALFRSP